MLSFEDGVAAVGFARRIVDAVVCDEALPVSKGLPDIFEERFGAFVTLKKYPSMELRGCIGIPLPILSLREALLEAGVSSATSDPRFVPVSPGELDEIVIEVSILEPPVEIVVDDPADIPAEIVVGRDGLIVECQGCSGLLLPQVPLEWEWDSEKFLSQTCVKAGLGSQEWLGGDVRVSRFSGRVFSECESHGDIKEVELS